MKNRIGFLRLLSLWLAVVMLLSVFSGCAKEEETVPDAPVPRPAEAVLDGTFTVGDSDPVLTLKVLNTELQAAPAPEMFRLGGAFSGLTVTGAAVSDDQLTLTTEGLVTASPSCRGTVSLSAEATAAAEELCAGAEVGQRVLYADPATCLFDAAAVSFDVVISLDTFCSDAPEICLDGRPLQVTAVSEDRTRAAVTAEFSGGTPETLNGKTLTVSPSSLSSGGSLETELFFPAAQFRAYADYVAEEDGVTY